MVDGLERFVHEIGIRDVAFVSLARAGEYGIKPVEIKMQNRNLRPDAEFLCNLCSYFFRILRAPTKTNVSTLAYNSQREKKGGGDGQPVDDSHIGASLSYSPRKCISDTAVPTSDDDAFFFT